MPRRTPQAYPQFKEAQFHRFHTPAPTSPYKKAAVLAMAAFLGWLLNKALFPHHEHAHAAPSVSSEDTGALPEKYLPRTERRPVIVAPSPRVIPAPVVPQVEQKPAPIIQETVNPPVAPVRPVEEPTLQKRDYPSEVALMLSPTDWPYARSALITAATRHFTQPVPWQNPYDGHSGLVTLSGAKADYNGCRQFRITLRQPAPSDPKIAHVDFCRDGIIK